MLLYILAYLTFGFDVSADLKNALKSLTLQKELEVFKKCQKKVFSGADVFSELVGSWSLKFWVCVHGLNSNFARWDPEDGKAIEGQPGKGVKKRGTFEVDLRGTLHRCLSGHFGQP